LKRLRQELISLLKKESETFWFFSGKLPYSTRELIQELNEMHKEDLVETTDEKIHLTEKGKKFAEENEILTAIEWDEKFEKQLLEKFSAAVKNRPKALTEPFDQGIMREKDSVQRAVLMGKNFDVDSKNILIIGDDDLVSIALALTKRAKKILVLEIDERFNNFINDFAEKNSLELKAVTWSVEEELAPELRKQFDVFLSDPVETFEGIKLFLGRGMSALKGIDSCFYFGLTSIDSGKEKWHKIEEMILNSGFIFTEIVKDQAFYPVGQFDDYQAEKNKYAKVKAEFPVPKAKETYFRSNFLRCLAVKEIVPPVKGQIKLDEKMYWDEEII